MRIRRREEVGQTGKKDITVSILWLAGQGRHGAVDLEEEAGEKETGREVSRIPGVRVQTGRQ